MASTYSTSLRLELMATGDQSGTWGDTTNTNLGTLLEQAITGVLSVAQGDAELTLTALDGATDQSRNAVVNLTGAMTGAQNVVVPNANKLYLIKNSTTGGFAVTVKTSAGTGVTVPAGTARWVYADGTNVVDGMSGPWSPSSNDAQALGISGTAWSDLFLASGGVINWVAGDVTITHSANTLAFAGASSGYTFDAAVLPSADNAAALGASGTAWADLFLASGGVINWNAGDVRITHSADTLAFEGASSGYTFDGPLSVSSGSGESISIARTSETASSAAIAAVSGAVNLGTTAAVPLVLRYNSTEWGRLSSSTTMQVGQTSTTDPADDNVSGLALNSTRVSVNAPGGSALNIGRGGNGTCVTFYNAGTPVGSIQVGAGTTTYTTSSDIRLKEPLETLATLVDVGAIIDALDPIQWQWKKDGTHGIGFVAQDLVKVVPEAVARGDDNLDLSPKDEGFEQWGVDASRLVPYLVAELQILRRRVAKLEQSA